MHIIKWKEPIWKATNYMITNRLHSGRGKTTEKVKRSIVVRALEGREASWVGKAQDFYGNKSILYDTILVDTYGYTCV